jgi:ATP synthase protein I
MSYQDALSRDVRRVAMAQALLTLLVAGGFGLFRGGHEALAALYGGLVTILITVWLARRVRRAGDARSAGEGLAVIYSGAMVRYALVVLLIGAALLLLKLPPVPLLIAFAVTQFGFLANAWRGRTGS